MKKKSNIEISELFLVKTMQNKTFVGQIIRKQINNKNFIVYGNVIINKNKILSMASTEYELGKNLDEITTMILENKFDKLSKNTINILKIPFFLN